MKKIMYKLMISLAGIFLGICICTNVVTAKEVSSQTENTDLNEIKLQNAELLQKKYGIWEVDAPAYYFTKESAGKYIPVVSPINGTVFFRCVYVDLLNADKEEINGSGFYTDGYPYLIYSVKKNTTYYVYVPQNIETGTITMFVYPDNIKNIKMDTTYFQTGTGENTYKYFNLKKLSLVDVQIVPASVKGRYVTCYLQKRIKGKWKTITKERKIIRDQHAESEYYRAPYGLSSGKYRIVTKTAKGAKFWLHAETKKFTNHGKNSKRKAKKIKNGKEVEGVLACADKKVHWYKVKADREIQLTFTTSMEPYGVTFTIYKNGIKKPVKVLTLKGKSGRKDWEQYKRRKKYTLEDGDGTYYIKVSRKHAKANGWYAIEN